MSMSMSGRSASEEDSDEEDEDESSMMNWVIPPVAAQPKPVVKMEVNNNLVGLFELFKSCKARLIQCADDKQTTGRRYGGSTC